MRAISAFRFEAGISTSSRSACSPLRTRVRKSATGSVIDMALPARLRHAGDHPLVLDLADADPAQAELAEIRARATAPLAAVVVACLVLGSALLADLLGSLCHLAPASPQGTGLILSPVSVLGRGGLARPPPFPPPARLPAGARPYP